MSSDRPSSGRQHNWGAISIAITLVAGGAAVVARFVAVEEFKTNAVETMRDHGSRISALERNNTLLERIHHLEMLNAQLQTELRQMSKELNEQHKARR